jgi:hypothetical protein
MFLAWLNSYSKLLISSQQIKVVLACLALIARCDSCGIVCRKITHEILDGISSLPSASSTKSISCEFLFSNPS